MPTPNCQDKLRGVLPENRKSADRARKKTWPELKFFDSQDSSNACLKIKVTLVENRTFVLSSKWYLHRLAYEPRLKGFFSTGSSCQRAKWSPWSSSTGSLGIISTGSCHEPVLKVSRLPRSRCQTFSTGFGHGPVLEILLINTAAHQPSPLFFSFGRCERGCASLVFSPMHKRCLMKCLRAWTNLSSHKIKMIWGARAILRSCPRSFLLDRG
jgi:hypothetical protein